MLPTHTLLVCLLLVTRLWAQGSGAAPQTSRDGAAELSVGPPALLAQDAQLLRLRDGRPLWGWIEAHDARALEVRRLDNGGLVVLPWGLLDPLQEHELRLAYGYIELEEQELMLEADLIPLANGKQIIGLIVYRSDDALHVKTAQSLLVIPKAQLAGASSSVQVPALDIFSREELYEQQKSSLRAQLSLTGAAAASAHKQLAQYCERILDFAHAVEHWSAVRELSPDFETKETSAALARAQLKQLAQAEIDYLNRIDTEKKRGKFDAALALSAAFPKLFPKSPLQEEWLKLQGRVQKAQEAALADQISERWHYHAARLTRDAARKLSYQAALQYVDDRIKDELLEAVVEDLREIAGRLQVADVKKLWTARSGGRWKKASYGLGTWLLGEERARAGLKPETSAEVTEKDSERADLQAKIERYLKNQELARSSQEGPADGEDPEAFWQSFSVSSRAQWLLAYYAENSGDMQLRRVDFENCRDCAGSGARSVLFTGNAMSSDPRTGEAQGNAGESLVACPTCHQVGVVRRITYR